MVYGAMSKKALNDNDAFTFSRIGLAADLILNKLRLQACLSEVTEQKEWDSRDGDRSNPEKDKDAEKREYIEQRLKDWAAFERKAKR
jgi:hypothetical protein